MRTSVIVTNHDYGRFLGEAIDSALAQLHPDGEVIVVDDGSTDGSTDVIASYDERVVAVMKGNGGQGSAMNAGFAACTGDVVIFLDADDVLLPTATGEAVRLLSGDPAAVKAHWPLEVIEEDGTLTETIQPAEALADGDLRPTLRTCPVHAAPPQSGNAYTRAFLEAVLPMPEEPYRTGADTWPLVMACGFGAARACGTPSGRYRRHVTSDGKSRTFDDQIATWFTWHEPAWRALADHCKRSGLPHDVDAWRRASWPSRMRDLGDALATVIPAGEPFVLIDDGRWGLLPGGRWAPRPLIPSADRRSGLARLDALHREGTHLVVLADHAHWWLQYYSGLGGRLADRRRLLDDDHATVFDLDEAA